MVGFFLLGGFPPKVSRNDIENYLYGDLDLELGKFWMDPLHVSRAVFILSNTVDIKEIQDKIKANPPPFGNEKLFLGTENETSCILVGVPAIECKALIDKLPWLFHQRQNGGSKVSSIVLIEENNYKLTFQVGWDAVQKVLKSQWHIEEECLKVTPYFSGFQESYEDQLERLSLCATDTSSIVESFKATSSEPTVPSGAENCNLNKEEKQLTKVSTNTPHDFYIGQNLLKYLDCLSLKEQTEEMFPDLNVHLNTEEGRVSMNGPLLLIDKYKAMLEYLNDLKNEQWLKNLEMFLTSSKHRQAIKSLLHNQRIHIIMDDCNDEFELSVMKNDEKWTLSEFSTSAIESCEFELSTISAEMEQKRQAFQIDFNDKSHAQKLKESGKNQWCLYQFRPVISHEQETNAQKNVSHFLQTNKFTKQKSAVPAKTFLPQANRCENVHVDERPFLNLLCCLHLKEKITERFKDVQVDVDGELLSLKGPSSVVEKLKVMLVNLFSVIKNLEVVFKDNFELFLKTDQSCAEIKRHFQDCGTFILLEETKQNIVEIFVKDQGGKKTSFEDFARAVLKEVEKLDIFEAAQASDELHRFQVEFNKENSFFSLKKIEDFWHLLAFGYVEQNVLEKKKEISSFLSKFYHKLEDQTNRCGVRQPTDRSDSYATDEFKDGNEYWSDKLPTTNHPIDNDFTSQSLRSFPLEGIKANFLGKHNFQEMKKTFKKKDIVLSHIDEANHLYYQSECPDVKVFTEFQNYITKIQTESIRLEYPGIPEFFRTNDGQKMIGDIEKKHNCFISLKNKDNKIVKEKKSSPPMPTILGKFSEKKMNIYLAQADDRNIPKDYSLHIIPASSSEIPTKGFFISKTKLELHLCDWSVENQIAVNREKEKEYVENYLNSLLKEIVAIHRRDLYITISVIHRKTKNSFPCDILAKGVFNQVYQVFKDYYWSVNIFLCESHDISLLKAYQWNMNSWKGVYSTTFDPPEDRDLIWIFDEDCSLSPANSYPPKMKFKVQTDLPDVVTIQSSKESKMICIPVDSPLPLDFFPWKAYWNINEVDCQTIMTSIEKCHPDGLIAGEVHVLKQSPLNFHEVAIYGKQEWGPNIKGAVEETLKNCVLAGKENNIRTLFIMVPGISKYPQSWLASRWFNCLDNLVEKELRGYDGTVIFVVNKQPYFKIFANYLDNRATHNLQNLFRAEGNNKWITQHVGCELDVTALAPVSTRKVTNQLNEGMRKILKGITVKHSLTAEQYNLFYSTIRASKQLQVICTIEKKEAKKTKEEVFHLQIQGLTKNAIQEVESSFLDKNKKFQGQRKSQLSQFPNQTTSTVYDHDKNKSSLPPVDSFQWLYCDDYNGSYIFNEEESGKLEQHYNKGQKEYQLRNLKIDFSSMKVNITDNELVTFALIRRQILEVKPIPKPEHWNDKRIRELRNRHPSFVELQSSILESNASLKKNFSIMKIELIQNLELLRRYETFNKNKEEKVMWQKIDKNRKTNIAEYGCEKAFLNAKFDELSDGVGFISEIENCFTKDDIDSIVLLVRCKVCLGAEGKGHHGLRAPPNQSSSVSGDLYSNIFNSVHAYPTHFFTIHYSC